MIKRGSNQRREISSSEGSSERIQGATRQLRRDPMIQGKQLEISNTITVSMPLDESAP